MGLSLVLASGSPYKRQLMERLGLAFETLSADVDESSLADEAPEETARRLAHAKAKAVAAERPEAWVLGADQVIALDGRRFSKPGSDEGARRQLAALSGKTHRLITSVALLTPDEELFESTAEYQMQMRPLSEAEIAAYVAEDTPTDCAGAYKIEAGGIRLFRALRGDDYTAIVGLPLTHVWHLLEQAKFFEAYDANTQ
ncbi:septum formation protein Maf [Persicimonas caeni]|uniref:7-methyl-GTP pyrophosphatase n=1 Tax=Persicimonas caeni TaxID=2292766 RepID=A0A4Y6PN03_PERCE|nr:nucleoside triphosphate pyrophosphatase [Persicimonas caeni]QDG49698.1 septum formation protein Maf [Persicimonas caeni]QED30919.1 septum formation protein Maf [Persicimonas caeni]